MLNFITKNKRKIIGRTEMLKELLKVEGLNRKDITVYSSWRSLEEQKALVKAGKSKTLNSNHRRGVAVDIIGWDKVEKEMRKHGMINDISWDRNHFVLGGEVKGTTYGLIDSLPQNLQEFFAPVSVPDPNSTSLPTLPKETPPTPSSDATEPLPINATGGDVVWSGVGNTVPDKEELVNQANAQMVESVWQLLINTIKKMKDIIIGFVKTNKFKTFCWNALGTFLGILAVYLGDLDQKYLVVIVPAILAISKYLNTRK